MPESKGKLPRLVGRIAAHLGVGPSVDSEIDKADAAFGTHAFNGGYSASALQGQGGQVARNRLLIYRKWQAMLTDPIISSALRLHVTNALGGHETSGDVVFIECKPEFENDKAASALVKELRTELAPIFNRIAYSLCFNAAVFGDSFGRMHTKSGVGITDVNVDQLFMPPLVQAYERGSRTEGFVVYVGKRMREKLSAMQMVRMRLPRTIYEPQPLAVEMARRASVVEDDVDKTELMPALAGGSFLQGAEEAYDRYLASLLALVGMRSKESIDAAWLKVNVSGMTEDAQKTLLDSVTNAQNYLKALQRQAIATKNPILEAIRFLIPVSDEKQVTTLEDAGSTSSGQGYSIEDVMLHAKLLAGALGGDMSMLGFSELLSGGLGDGGFFRVSAQAAERSRMLRVALDEAFNHMVTVHLIVKKRAQFDASQQPWQINFYSTVSALETERAKTRDSLMTSGQILVGMLESLKNLGLKKEAVQHILSKIVKLDEDSAILLARSLEAAVPLDSGGLDGFGGPPGAAPGTVAAKEEEDAAA